MSEGGYCGSGQTCGSRASNEDISRSIGYSEEELKSFGKSNLGLGCGNPVAMASIKEGDVVLDLGSGAGFDAFIALRKVGESGRVIGVDFTEEMIEKARKISEENGFDNVEFRLGDIEDLPVDDSSVDVVISNCVINLAPDKGRVFREAWRVLKDKGKMFVSDIVLLSELSEKKRKDERLLCGCVGGAMMKDDYIEVAKSAGFDVEVLSLRDNSGDPGEDKGINKEQYKGVDLESLKLRLVKRTRVEGVEKRCCCNG